MDQFSNVTIESLPALVARLECRLRAKAGHRYVLVSIGLSRRAGWTVSLAIHVDGLGEGFTACRLSDALRAADEWLDRDEDAELNATLGLTADGRLRGAEQGAA